MTGMSDDKINQPQRAAESALAAKQQQVPASKLYGKSRIMFETLSEDEIRQQIAQPDAAADSPPKGKA